MQFLKATYLNDVGQLSHDAPEVSEADIEDAMAFHDEAPGNQQEDDVMTDGPPDDEDEMEAMIASYEEQQTAPPRPCSPAMSDEDYDNIFSELLAQEQPMQQDQPPSLVGCLDEDHAMSF